MGFYLADFEKTSCCAKVFVVVGEKLLRSVKQLQKVFVFVYLNNYFLWQYTHTHTPWVQIINWSDLFREQQGSETIALYNRMKLF